MKLNQSGQTSVEYILMIVVVIAITSGLFGKLEGFLITNPDSFMNTYLDSYKDLFINYKYFKLHR